jgi:hypothetical protein
MSTHELMLQWAKYYKNSEYSGAEPGGENMIFWRRIVIFHTKYPKHFRSSLRSAQIY